MVQFLSELQVLKLPIVKFSQRYQDLHLLSLLSRGRKLVLKLVLEEPLFQVFAQEMGANLVGKIL